MRKKLSFQIAYNSLGWGIALVIVASNIFKTTVKG